VMQRKEAARSYGRPEVGLPEARKSNEIGR
jgi:hypothetical protein